jgi:hypothetical protein
VNTGANIKAASKAVRGRSVFFIGFPKIEA